MRQVPAYVRGPRFRRPPRGAMYQAARATAMTAAAIATTATVEAATITRGMLFPRFRSQKRRWDSFVAAAHPSDRRGTSEGSASSTESRR
jgi:hypothetical protein